MFTIIGNAISSFFWGIVITVVLVGFIFLITKLFHNRIRMSLSKMFSIVVISLFFLFQTTLFMAGIKAKGYISSVHSFLFETLSNKTASLQQDISINDLNAYAELIDQKYPILQSFLPQVKDVASIAKGQINSVADYANVIVQILNQQVNFYLWKRAGWIIGGWLLLLLIMLYEKRSPYANGGYGTSTSTSTQMRF